MKLAGCSSLALGGHTGTWYRALPPVHWTAPLSTGHTTTVTSRFSAAHPRRPGFEILYLAETSVVALFEINALLGYLYGAHVPNPAAFFTVLTVQVRLRQVADLTLGPERRKVATSVQELTGDWRGYKLRDITTSPMDPYPPHVPTHRLGDALYNVPDLEGFLTYSAKVPDRKNLVLFPQKLDPASRVVCFDSSGNQIQRIP